MPLACLSRHGADSGSAGETCHCIQKPLPGEQILQARENAWFRKPLRITSHARELGTIPRKARCGSSLAIWRRDGGDDKIEGFVSTPLKLGLTILALVTVIWTSRCLGQTAPQAHVQDAEQSRGKSAEPNPASPLGELSVPPMFGGISGKVVDQSGAVIGGARVKLAGNDPSASRETVTTDEGEFSFVNVGPGSFQLTVMAEGFATQAYSGLLHPGESDVVPDVALAVATAVTEVVVGVSQTEVAEEQMKVEEKQLVLGVLPNFYVSYIPDAAPLNSKQKFRLAAKTVVNPFTFVMVGGGAGIEQAQNHFRGYGQGAQGYAKRFAAGYADTVSGTFIGGAILPSLLKQDPRYFYKGHGSLLLRAGYAIANSVICKGDNKRWQANYSSMLGNLAAGGISNLYYPAQDRTGAGLTFENAAIGIGESAISNLFQEFLIRKLTPKVPKNPPATR
jgi:hypothetical protein